MSVWVDWATWRCAVCGWTAEAASTDSAAAIDVRSRIRAHLQTHDPALRLIASRGRVSGGERAVLDDAADCLDALSHRLWARRP